MSIFNTVKNIINKKRKADVLEHQENVDDAVSTIKNWYSEKYEAAVIQRNWMMAILVLALIALTISSIALRYIGSTKVIEPFVIEIEKNTGVPTVVDPLTVKAYSADDAILRYFINKYVRAREEYYPSTYTYNYNVVVRVLSKEDVYYGDYRPKYSTSNIASPASTLSSNGYRTLTLKSIIFPTPKTAQVRFSLKSVVGNGASVSTVDKIALVQFDFRNLKMNDEERLINPLGFMVTLYRSDDEKIQ